MNELFFALGIEHWKPLAKLLVLPPVPFVLLVLVGARLMFRRRLLAWLLILIAVTGMWLASTSGAAKLLHNGVLRPPPVLSEAAIGELRKAPRTAIVVLGGGRRPYAPEYGVATLSARGMERLHFGLWLARETSLPVAFAGGIGLGAPPGPTEAEVAARIAERDYGRPLRWLESESRDTRENALRIVALLQPQGIETLVIVTHADHMRRTLRNFEAAAAGAKLKLVPAPVGLYPSSRYRLDDWLPTLRGYESTWVCLHEWLGLLAGA